MPDESSDESPDESPDESLRSSPSDTVGSLSELYLGNILYSLERTAMDLEGAGKATDAAFYRGIARKLAEAHGRSKKQQA